MSYPPRRGGAGSAPPGNGDGGAVGASGSGGRRATSARRQRVAVRRLHEGTKSSNAKHEKLDPHEEFQDLQKRFYLLSGDMKAYAEAAEYTVQHNAETLKSLRLENRKLREDLQRWRAIEEGLGMARSLANEVDRIDREVVVNRGRVDMLVAANREKEADLKRFQDQLEELKVDAVRATSANGPQTQAIRTLENRLDKAMIKYNEAMSIRKTYEQILKRLKEERLSFENQLTAMERTLESKDHDFRELEVMNRDALHARDIAEREYQRFSEMVAEERAEKKRMIAEKTAMVNAKETVTASNDREAAAATSVPDGTINDDDFDEPDGNEALLAEEHERKIAAYEEAFRKIKDATGVSEVNEVIQKFLAQEDTHTNLENVKISTENHIAHLRETQRKLEARVEELRYTGSGAGPSRTGLEDLERYLAEAEAEADQNKQRRERVARILIDVKAGVDHLADILDSEHINNTGDGEKISVVAKKEEVSVADVLGMCQERLVGLMADVQLLSGGSVGGATTIDARLGMQQELELPTSNRRVQFPISEEDSDSESSDDPLDDEDVPTREDMKREAEKILADAEKAAKSKKATNRRRPTESRFM